MSSDEPGRVATHAQSRPQLKRTARAELHGALSRNSSIDDAVASSASSSSVPSLHSPVDAASSESAAASSPIDIVDGVIAAASASPSASPPQHDALQTKASARPRKLTRTTTYRDYCSQTYHAPCAGGCSDACFFGDYVAERRTRNYHYHSNFSRSRQLFQDSLVRAALLAGVESDAPRLIFTAGPMGAGKGYALKLVAPQVGVNLDEFLKIDPDQIKELLPEYQMLKKKDPTIAGSQVHQESGFVQELVLERALKLSKNIVLDGSLRDWQWYLKEIERIQTEYPAYRNRLDIVVVQASEATVMRRARERGLVTGRVIPPALLRDCIRQVPLSIDILKHAVRKTYFVNNEQVPFIESTFTSDQSGAALQAIVNRTKTQAELVAHSMAMRDTVMLAAPLVLELSTNELFSIATAMHGDVQKLGSGPNVLAFAGASAVDWLVAHKHAGTRADAVQIGQQLLEQGVLRHVNTSAAFSDSRELFRFLIDDCESKAKFAGVQGVLHVSMAALDEDYDASGIATLVLKMLDAEFERDNLVQITIQRFATLAQFSEFAAHKRAELAKRFRPALLHNSAPLVWFSDGGGPDEYVGGCTQLLIAALAFPKFARSRALFALREAYFLRDLLGTPPH